jgi:hypothetical protein
MMLQVAGGSSAESTSSMALTFPFLLTFLPPQNKSNILIFSSFLENVMAAAVLISL